jgi:hypothetical protein
VDSSDVTERPVLLKSSIDFLNKNKESFAIRFDHAEELSESSARLQVFKLFNHLGQTIGKASFEYDQSGRLLSLKIH